MFTDLAASPNGCRARAFEELAKNFTNTANGIMRWL